MKEKTMTPQVQAMYLACLNRTVKSVGNTDIMYNEKDEDFSQEILSVISTVVKHLETFYLGSINPRISVFIYPDLEAMSQAFGKEIKSVDWCYAKIRDVHSLITFTSGLDKASITQVLVHEFSHVFFSRITGNRDVGNYRQSVPLWLDEGISLHLDSKFRPHDFCETVRKRREILRSEETEYIPVLMDMYTYFNRLDGDGFGVKSFKAYAYSYFCVKALIEQFGEKHMYEFITKPDLAGSFDRLFEDHFGFSLTAYNSKMTHELCGL